MDDQSTDEQTLCNEFAIEQRGQKGTYIQVIYGSVSARELTYRMSGPGKLWSLASHIKHS